MSSTIITKKRLLFILIFCIAIILFLIIRLFHIQVIKGIELREKALEQWSRNIPVPSKRGMIYDRNKNILATNVSSYTIWARPADIFDPDKVAIKIANILDMDSNEIHKLITKRQSLSIIKKWISKKDADKLRSLKIKGIEVVDDNKRYYPMDNFASHILGFTDIDNYGLYGIEKIYDEELTGTNGKWIKMVDGKQKQLPYESEGFFEPKPGNNILLTIDETIQHLAEKAALEALVKNKAKNVSVIVMDPNNGELLAMATKPDYNPNNRNTLLFNPDEEWKPLDENERKEYKDLPWDQKSQLLYESWRNFSINDNYEPGSTFKIITAAAGLEEKVVTQESKFHCDGYVTQIKGAKIKCWRYYNPHGSQNFTEGVQNSCNEVFVSVGLKLGEAKMHEYVEKFGFGEKTGIELTGETSGIVRPLKSMKKVNLATISFGQGISVTPIQMVSAISAVANGGNLMEPNIVKSITDNEGNLIKEKKEKIVRRVISNETSKELLEILESVVSKGSGSKAYKPGYKIGGKTGTAQKVIDGKYANGKYIASFAGIAPVDNPKAVALVVIDEPSAGVYYGGQIAAPVAGNILKETLDYLDYEPKLSKEEKEEYGDILVTVPNLKGLTITEASKKLRELELEHVTDIVTPKKEDKVIDQIPKSGTEVKKEEIIELYLKNPK
ncbi:stage V sporulation protein D [Senegalia massiliensis]|uniref:stage V sporulation protein D n=1 Tax=Senegalia massiliensis TaxID=1720316 RepID=UPI0010321130|nr:stage V sporulation protein D [Senegalia massiliensis]